MATSRSDVSHSSVPELFAGALADAKEIAVGHLGHMKDEIGSELTELKHYIARVVVAVGVIVVGSMMAGEALAHGLVRLIGLPMWGGFLLATVVAFGIGYLLVSKLPGNKKNMDLVPESSMDDLKKDIADIGHEASRMTH